MAEKVLDEALSGEEIVLAVLDNLGTTLRRDCFLSANAAYQTFRVQVHVHIVAHDVGREAIVDRELVVRSKEEPSPDVPIVEVEYDIEPAEPNRVRVETGQPVPVQSRDEGGRLVTKGVKYKRKTGK